MEVAVGFKVAFGAGKTGVVRYLGETDFAKGEWVGIELERPEGKNNGEINGRVYFTCPPNHGLFVKRTQIKSILSVPSGSRSSTEQAPPAPTSTSSSASRMSSSRLQELRDRRLSGVGVARRPSSASSTTGATGSAPSSTAASRLAASRTRSSVSTPPAGAAGSSARGRLSLDPSTARRGSLSRSNSGAAGSASDEQLAEAATRIAKLEEELEQKNRHVEQLKQSVAVMKETAVANTEKIKQLEEQEAKVEQEKSDAQADNEEEEMQSEPMDVDDAEQDQEETELSPQEEMAQQISAVKLQAEEHVRSVRSEFEEHVAALQSEHEELLDELRLENATQASEIKALENEVAQQKARLAQFTASEQKKAEEVALAVAKTSAGARKVETLEKQLAEFQDMVEMLTLEKETAEMDKEIAEESVEDLQQELEKLKASVALASAASSTEQEATSGHAATPVSVPGNAELAEENKKLRVAVKTLHERAAEEKADLSKRLRQAQRENTELVALREEVEELTKKKNKLESEAEELKEMLDVANAYESMVEDLTEKNLTLGEKVAELETTVQSLESLHEVDQEMEHQHTEYEAELRDEIDSQRAAVQELKQAVASQKTVLEDKERTIARFRDLAHGHRDEIAQLKAQLRAESGAVESLRGETHVALNQNMGLRALAAAAREHETEAAKQKLVAEQARLENSFLRAVVPSSIFSETDQKVLRVRLTLGRVAGKADILLQHVKKQLDAVAQKSSSSDEEDEAKDDAAATSSAPASASGPATVRQMVLGDKLAAVSCQAKEDLFMLECHLTTEEEFAEGCSALDSSQTLALENALDAALTAFSEGALLLGGGEATSAYDRLIQASEEWHASRTAAAAAATGAEGFAARCAVVKLRARKQVAKLAFSVSATATFVRATTGVLGSAEMPDDAQTAALRSELAPVLDKGLEELLAVLGVAQLLYRRAEIDLASSDDDLDGLVAVGGEVVSAIEKYAAEAQTLWVLLESKLAHAGLLEPAGRTSAQELVQFAQESVLDEASTLKEKLASLFKLVCRGAFTDAVAPRTRSVEQADGSANGRPQWHIRAQAIHQELLDASTLRASLAEMKELCAALHMRIRELERADSQHRVVAQKLESEVLRLTESVQTAAHDKTALEAQLTKEREQFDVALDESNKEKTSLDALNRELRKQLKRSSDAGSSSAKSASGPSGKAAAMSAADAEAFRRVIQQLHQDLHAARAALAKERLEQRLGSPIAGVKRGENQKSSERLTQSLKEVATFSRQVKAQLAMPRLVDLKRAEPAHAQLVVEKLQQSRAQQELAALRQRVASAMGEDGWGQDVTTAITRGESVFGWQVPEMERPPVLLGRVTMGGRIAAKGSNSSVQLVLNRSEVQQLSQILVC